MLHWLAAWLQQIIAVVLLAGFIDLLLPNKSMQRYVRLVAGLIILLTILTPIMRLLQGDFNERLDRNMENWFREGSVKEVHMPTLEDIQRDAAALERKSQASAAALAQNQLAGAMRDQLARQTGLQNVKVAVSLDPSADRDDPAAAVASIVVTLPAARNAEESEAGTSEQAESSALAEVEDGLTGNQSDGSESGAKNGDQAGSSAGGNAAGDNSDAAGAGVSSSDGDSVQDVASVDVTVQVDADEDGGNGSDAWTAGQSDYVPVEGAAADSIRRMLSAGWAVDPAIVSVRQLRNPDL